MDFVALISDVLDRGSRTVDNLELQDLKVARQFFCSNTRQLKRSRSLAALAVFIIVSVIGTAGASANEAPPDLAINETGFDIPSQHRGDLLQGWLTALAADDVDIALGALELYIRAPHGLRAELTDGALATNILPKLYLRASGDERNQIEELLQGHHAWIVALENELSARLAEAAKKITAFHDITRLSLLFNELPSVPETLASTIVDTFLTAENPQIMEALAIVMRKKPASFSHETDRLSSLVNQSEDILNEGRARNALFVLLMLDAQLPTETILAALDAPLQDPTVEALEYISRRAPPLDPRILESVRALLLRANENTVFELAASVLAQHDSTDYVSSFEKVLPRIAGKSTLFKVSLLNHVPVSLQSAVLDWPLSTDDEFTSQESDCRQFAHDVQLLMLRATVTEEDLWALLTQPNTCSKEGDGTTLVEPIIADHNLLSTDYLQAQYERSATEFRDFLNSVKYRTPVSPILVDRLKPLLLTVVDRGDWEVAHSLAEMEITFGSDQAANGWTKILDPPSLERAEVIKLINALPYHAPAVEPLMEIAEDGTKAAWLRRAALGVVLKAPSLSGLERRFIELLKDVNPLVTSGALRALVRFMQDPSRTPRDPGIPMELLTKHIGSEATGRDVRQLLVLLAAESDRYDETLAAAVGPRSAQGDCWDLSPSRLVPPERWLAIIELGLQNPSVARSAQACVITLTSGDSAAQSIAGHVLASDQSPSDDQQRGELFSAFNEHWLATPIASRLRNRIAADVPQLLRALPYTIQSQKTLKDWETRLEPLYRDAADQISNERTQRRTLAIAAALPITVGFHALIWVFLLALYPLSSTVRATFFWNAKARRFLGAGYVDYILSHVPFARRILFAPFKEQLLGDVAHPNAYEHDRTAYYTESHVRQAHDAKPRAIMEALGDPRGRMVLLGPSGIGKSSYLRNLLFKLRAQGRDIAVFLRADHCRDGVEAAIAKRAPGLLDDRNLIRTLVYNGALRVFIDGYNEVDVATQERISEFLAANPQANILVSSQIPLRGLKTLPAYYLEPLDNDQVREFLTSRVAILEGDLAVTGDDYVALAGAFLDQNKDADGALWLALSNPMDLTTVALLLAAGREPNLLSLQAQQFDLMRAEHLQVHGTIFRESALSQAVLDAMFENQDDLSELDMPAEVSSMIEHKLVLLRTYQVPGGSPKQAVRFRHDRIRDYVLHFAFLDDEERRYALSRDSRFAGVYELLARVLPPGPAERLKEYLLMDAVDLQDHRLSDQFLKLLRWRESLYRGEPEWLRSYDDEETKTLQCEFDTLSGNRRNIEESLRALQSELAAARKLNPILITYDELELARLGLEILRRMSFDVEEDDVSPRVTILNCTFELAPLASRDGLTSFHISLLRSRLARGSEKPLILTNANTTILPKERPPDISVHDREQLALDGASFISAIQLFEAFQKSRTNSGLGRRLLEEALQL